MAPTLTLFRKNGACSFVPHALLNEVSVPFSSVALDFNENNYLKAADNSFTHEEYRKIHPTGYVPALKVDDEIITELPAITYYIARLKSDRQLLGRTPLEQAKHDELMCYISGTLHAQGYGALWRSRRFTDSTDKAVHEGIQAGGKKRILGVYDALEARLEGPHAIGNELTVVDLTIYLFWRWGAMRLGIELEDFKKKYPKLAALAKEVEGLQSVRKTLEAEELPLTFREGKNEPSL
jgi:glutathione S-transferase